MRHSALSCCLALVSLSTIVAQERVFIVDPGNAPGTDFTRLDEAINAAGDGDVLILRESSYPATSISGKSISLIAEENADVLLDSIAISDLSADQEVTIRGIRAMPIMQRTTLEATSNAGPILIEDSQILGATGVGFLFPVTSSTSLTDCSSVTFVRCSLIADGNQTPPFGQTPVEGVHALIATDSKISLFDCLLRGGPNDTIGGQGGYGLLLTGGSVFASGCEFIGMDGGPAGTSIFGKLPGGDGGDGIELRISGASEARGLVTSSSFAGGSGGASIVGCPAGPDGTGIDSTGGSLVTRAGNLRSFEMTSPVRGGEQAILNFAGPQGDLLFLVVSQSHQSRFEGLLQATLVPGPNLLVLPIGLMPAAGVLQLELLMPPLPAAVDSLALVAQTAAISTSQELVLGTPSTLVLLNQGL
ncbi:MAG: hypothetical protein ACYTG5_05225 [Planctomycetota bacterium]|jgi:hypothetical protein